MSTTMSKYLIRRDWKESLAFLIGFAGLWWFVSAIWQYRAVLLIIITVALPLKAGMVIALSSQLVREIKGCWTVLAVLFLIPATIFILFFCDGDIFNLWADQLGQPTEATVTDLFTRGRTRSVGYAFVANAEDIEREQRVNPGAYDRLKRGDKVQVKFLPMYPHIVFLSDDGGYVQFQIAITLTIALGYGYILFDDQIKRWLKNLRGLLGARL